MSETPAPRLRRFRFGLRTMFVVLTAVSISAAFPRVVLLIVAITLGGAAGGALVLFFTDLVSRVRTVPASRTSEGPETVHGEEGPTPPSYFSQTRRLPRWLRKFRPIEWLSIAALAVFVLWLIDSPTYQTHAKPHVIHGPITRWLSGQD